MRAGQLRVVLSLLFMTFAGRAAAFQATAVPPPCATDHPPSLSPAEAALLARKFADAERRYNEMLAADPASGIAMAGLVRTTLAQDKLPEALAMATKYDAEHPNNAAILDALGEVRFRRGEVHEAAVAINQSSSIDPCSGLTHYDAARFLNLSGMYGSGQHELETAHALAPENPLIAARWRSTHAVPLTAEQRLASLHKRLDNQSLSDAQKEGINAAIKGVETREKGSCELVTEVAAAKLPMVPIASGLDPMATMYEAALEIQLNGRKRRFEVDTGASGLVLSRSVAKSAGLVPELQTKAGGIGDSGLSNAFVTHVDDVKIGRMEFKNCMVQVLESPVFDRMPDVDGLIGLDVFRDYLVTLDTPGLEVRLDPLPKRPDEQSAKTASLATADDEETPLSIADRSKDRYVAPEMKDWTPVFRSAHMLIVPTAIGKAPTKLFLVDTGAQHGMISPAAAREVTVVSGFSSGKVQGVSGEVQNLLVADKVSITFARVTQMLHGMDSFDTAGLSRSAGVDISGIIGFPTLRELVIAIDYRDNLIHVTYDPKKGYHPHQ